MNSQRCVPLCVYVLGLIVVLVVPLAMGSDSEAKNYMVYMHQKPNDISCETYQINALSKVLGSEEAAQKALLYHYSDVVSGFSAKLTPQQADQLKKLPEVSSVVISRPYSLYDPNHNV